MTLLQTLEEWLLTRFRDRVAASVVSTGRNRLPLGETDVSDHPEDDEGEWIQVDPGDPESQPPS